MSNKNLFSILLGVVSIWLLWPILRWAVGLVIVLVVLLVTYLWYKTKQTQKTEYRNTSKFNQADVFDVEYTERRVEDENR